MAKIRGLAAALLIAVLLCACAPSQETEMQDGYYTAQAAAFDEHGWMEYLTVYIKNNKIVTVEYNAKNVSGFIKSWDMSYMRIMNQTDGTYPNKYARAYVSGLLSRQDPAHVDAISGATHSYTSFQLLAQAVMAQARAGDKSVALVEMPANE